VKPQKPTLKSLAEQLISACTDDGNPTLCQETLEKLVSRGRVARTPLVNLLDHPRPEIRSRAIEALGRIGDRSVSARIAHILEYDPDFDVQGLAAEALGRLRAKGSTTSLIRALEAKDKGKRTDAILALARLRTPEATTALLNLSSRLRAEGSLSVATLAEAAAVYVDLGINGLVDGLASPTVSLIWKRGAVIILGETVDPASLSALIRASQHVDEPLRSKSLASLDRVIYELKVQQVPLQAQVIEELVPILREVVTSDSSARCRMQAALLLKAIGDPSVVPQLEKVRSTDPNSIVRESADEALVYLRRIGGSARE
jgi:HEAT repeat protein